MSTQTIRIPRDTMARATRYEQVLVELKFLYSAVAKLEDDRLDLLDENYDATFSHLRSQISRLEAEQIRLSRIVPEDLLCRDLPREH